MEQRLSTVSYPAGLEATGLLLNAGSCWATVARRWSGSAQRRVKAATPSRAEMETGRQRTMRPKMNLLLTAREMRRLESSQGMLAAGCASRAGTSVTLEWSGLGGGIAWPLGSGR